MTPEERRIQKAAYMRRYRLSHVEQERDRDRRRYRENPSYQEATKTRRRTQYRADPAADKARTATWATANPERRREIARDSNRRHADRVAIISRIWAQNNHDKVRANTARWRAAHPMRARASNWDSRHRRRALRADVPCTLTWVDWQRILIQHDSTCAYCGSTERITVDHVIPIERGGGHIADNVLPACLSCNSRKRGKTLDEWQPPLLRSPAW